MQDQFKTIFIDIISIFKYIQQFSILLLEWLSSPLYESIPGIGELIGEDLAIQTPVEFMFGAGLMLVIITGIIKFFTKIL